MKNKDWYGNNKNLRGGIMGGKYPSAINGKETKEHNAWMKMLDRCQFGTVKDKHPTYNNVTCCDEWMNYDNFYEWIINQDNYGIWKNTLDKFDLDKDIVKKGNKIYSPLYCELVPDSVNKLFTKRNSCRGDCPIGVNKRISKVKHNIRYVAQCTNNWEDGCRVKHLGHYNTPEEAFDAYKEYKEALIKRVAQREYEKETITKRCYNAMMNYIVEITD